MVPAVVIDLVDQLKVKYSIKLILEYLNQQITDGKTKPIKMIL